MAVPGSNQWPGPAVEHGAAAVCREKGSRFGWPPKAAVIEPAQHSGRTLAWASVQEWPL